jgi:hypothetical protein
VPRDLNDVSPSESFTSSEPSEDNPFDFAAEWIRRSCSFYTSQKQLCDEVYPSDYELLAKLSDAGSDHTIQLFASESDILLSFH